MLPIDKFNMISHHIPALCPLFYFPFPPHLGEAHSCLYWSFIKTHLGLDIPPLPLSAHLLLTHPPKCASPLFKTQLKFNPVCVTKARITTERNRWPSSRV